MTLLDIRVLGDPILRKPTIQVERVDDDLRSLIADMFETMYAAGGIGLAAPQVGRTERVTVVHVEGVRHALINPRIVERAGSARDEEGCLSIPDIYGDVTREERVMVTSLDEDGAELEVSASGLLARCLQHEIDHLDGKLFIDYLSTLKRRAAMAKWDGLKGDYPGYVRKVSREKADAHEHHDTEM